MRPLKLVLAPERIPDSTLRLSQGARIAMYGLIALGLAVLALVLWFAVAQPVKVLPRIASLPSFALEDQYGLPINSNDLAGRLVFINFSYTHCGDDCAAQRDQLVALREHLRAEGRLGSEVLLLTISFDPQRDTREALQTYAAQLGADRRSWRFATGDPAELKALIGGELGFYYGQADANGLIKHDQRVILVDSNGIIRARYQGERLRVQTFLRDIDLVRQELGSSGLMRQVYEASHLFLCYPD